MLSKYINYKIVITSSMYKELLIQFLLYLVELICVFIGYNLSFLNKFIYTGNCLKNKLLDKLNYIYIL